MRFLDFNVVEILSPFLLHGKRGTLLPTSKTVFGGGLLFGDDLSMISTNQPLETVFKPKMSWRDAINRRLYRKYIRQLFFDKIVAWVLKLFLVIEHICHSLGGVAIPP